MINIDNDNDNDDDDHGHIIYNDDHNDNTTIILEIDMIWYIMHSISHLIEPNVTMMTKNK